jgi:hypothetical protein
MSTPQNSIVGTIRINPETIVVEGKENDVKDMVVEIGKQLLTFRVMMRNDDSFVGEIEYLDNMDLILKHQKFYDEDSVRLNMPVHAYWFLQSGNREIHLNFSDTYIDISILCHNTVFVKTRLILVDPASQFVVMRKMQNRIDQLEGKITQLKGEIDYLKDYAKRSHQRFMVSFDTKDCFTADVFAKKLRSGKMNLNGVYFWNFASNYIITCHRNAETGKLESVIESHRHPQKVGYYKGPPPENSNLSPLDQEYYLVDRHEGELYNTELNYMGGYSTLTFFIHKDAKINIFIPELKEFSSVYGIYLTNRKEVVELKRGRLITTRDGGDPLPDLAPVEEISVRDYQYIALTLRIHRDDEQKK